ncbi:protein IQ-DOMAIN 19-like [Coffea arabica]|uniref:Protein IQ-DOMAIN 19-like n=1 Tax=Coffea arabica TaxID=13443 RepID=A0ABM4WN36_COFAR
MGKAGKWIRNFLLGKREEKDKHKKRVNSVATEVSNLGSPTAILSVTKEKRRWSFKKSTTTEKDTRRNLSFDSISTPHLGKQALEEHEIEQIRFKAILVATSKQVNGTMPVVTTPVSQAIGPLKDAAAIKIQAAFRSYLARKALCALRGLVKLQALVRGHLVRKQTTAVLRSMHALMTIQVRGRYGRVRMVEARAEIATKRSGHGESARNSTDRKDVNAHETRPLDYSQAERKELGVITTYHSGRFPINIQEDQPDQTCCSPSTTVTETSSTNLSTTKQIKLQASTAPHSHENRGYMSNTTSSKAKARSHSEPKQRPKKWRPVQKNKQSTSVQGVNVVPEVQEQCTPSPSEFNEQENQIPWFIKLYRSAKQVNGSHADHSSVATCNSNFEKTSNPFEVCSRYLANNTSRG